MSAMLLLEQAERVRVRQHERRRRPRRPSRAGRRGRRRRAASVRTCDRLVAGQAPRVAGFVPCAESRDRRPCAAGGPARTWWARMISRPQQLALRAGRRLQRHVRQARRSRRGSPAGAAAARARPAPPRPSCERVQRREARQRRDALVDLRVVLHRARAERVEVRVDREVQLREAHEVAHQLELARPPAAAAAPLAAQRLREQRRPRSTLRHVERRQASRARPGARALEDRLRRRQLASRPPLGSSRSTSSSARGQPVDVARACAAR